MPILVDIQPTLTLKQAQADLMTMMCTATISSSVTLIKIHEPIKVALKPNLKWPSWANQKMKMMWVMKNGSMIIWRKLIAGVTLITGAGSMIILWGFANQCWSGLAVGVATWTGQTLSMSSVWRLQNQAGHLDEWIYEVNCHASRGRRYLSHMENINGVLPKEMWRIRELWRQQVDLLKILLCGIDSIELRVNIVEKGMFNLITLS